MSVVAILSYQLSSYAYLEKSFLEYALRLVAAQEAGLFRLGRGGAHFEYFR